MPWEVLTGVVEWWADEGLRDVGRGRFHAARVPPQIVVKPGDDERLSGDATVRETPIHLARAVFAARRVPWRLTQISLGSPEDDPGPVVASWADDATAVLKGSPAGQHWVEPNVTWGDLGLRRMLEPAALATLVARPWRARFRVAGHLVEGDISVVPEFVSLASDHYDVTHDGRLDILTSWTAVIDGQVAQRISLTQLTVVELAPSGGPSGT